MEVAPDKSEKEVFYEDTIKSLKYMLNDIKTRGIDALGWIDKPKGVDGAITNLNSQISYFETKLKEAKDEKTNNGGLPSK